jgi:hypothetical protein
MISLLSRTYKSCRWVEERRLIVFVELRFLKFPNQVRYGPTVKMSDAFKVRYRLVTGLQQVEECTEASNQTGSHARLIRCIASICLLPILSAVLNRMNLTVQKKQDMHSTFNSPRIRYHHLVNFYKPPKVQPNFFHQSCHLPSPRQALLPNLTTPLHSTKRPTQTLIEAISHLFRPHYTSGHHLCGKTPLIYSDGVLDERKVDEPKLGDIFEDIALEDALAGTGADSGSARGEICCSG